MEIASRRKHPVWSQYDRVSPGCYAGNLSIVHTFEVGFGAIVRGKSNPNRRIELFPNNQPGIVKVEGAMRKHGYRRPAVGLIPCWTRQHANFGRRHLTEHGGKDIVRDRKE